MFTFLNTRRKIKINNKITILSHGKQLQRVPFITILIQYLLRYLVILRNI